MKLTKLFTVLLYAYIAAALFSAGYMTVEKIRRDIRHIELIEKKIELDREHIRLLRKVLEE